MSMTSFEDWKNRREENLNEDLASRLASAGRRVMGTRPMKLVTRALGIGGGMENPKAQQLAMSILGVVREGLANANVKLENDKEVSKYLNDVINVLRRELKRATAGAITAATEEPE